MFVKSKDMLPFEYITAALKNFIIEFPKTRVRYEMDTQSNTHSIEVIPNEIYRLDDDYISWENIFFDAFINQFPDQKICFISDNAVVGLDKIDFQLCGKEYVSIEIKIPTSESFNALSNIAINTIQVQSKGNKKPASTNAINLQPTTTLDLKTNLIQEVNSFAVLNQYNYSLAA